MLFLHRDSNEEKLYNFRCSLVKYYTLFSAGVGFNTLVYRLYFLEMAEEVFVAWKYFVVVVQVILGNVVIKALEKAVTELSSR